MSLFVSWDQLWSTPLTASLHTTKPTDYVGYVSFCNPRSKRRKNWDWGERSLNLLKRKSCFDKILIHIPFFCLPSLILLWGSPQKGFMYWNLNLCYFLTYLILPSMHQTEWGEAVANTQTGQRHLGHPGWNKGVEPKLCLSASLPTAGPALRSWQHHLFFQAAPGGTRMAMMNPQPVDLQQDLHRNRPWATLPQSDSKKTLQGCWWIHISPFKRPSQVTVPLKSSFQWVSARKKKGKPKGEKPWVIDGGKRAEGQELSSWQGRRKEGAQGKRWEGARKSGG